MVAFQSLCNDSDELMSVPLQEVLYLMVGKIAGDYLETERRAEYVAAAKDFRMPYWHWALEPTTAGGVTPEFLLDEELKGKDGIVTPKSKGERVPFPNPLHHFKFNPLNPQKGGFDDRVSC